jgi:hypothetical protein
MEQKNEIVKTEDQMMLYVMFIDLLKNLDGNHEAYVTTCMIVDLLQKLQVLEKSQGGTT